MEHIKEVIDQTAFTLRTEWVGITEEKLVEILTEYESWKNIWEKNDKVAKPFDIKMKKAYEIGLRLAQIDAIRSDRDIPTEWGKIPTEETGRYYHEGLTKTEGGLKSLTLKERIKLGWSIFRGI